MQLAISPRSSYNSETMELTNPINVRFTAAQRAQLEHIGVSQGSTLPELVRRAVDFWLEHRPRSLSDHLEDVLGLPKGSARAQPEIHEPPPPAKPAPSRFARGVKIRRR